MIVTIDGPAGAGKSTVARALALRLGYHFLDTGAMYRAVTYAAMQKGVDLGDSAELAALASRLEIELVGEHVLVDGQNVSQSIRTGEVTAAIHYAADNPEVRKTLVRLQRKSASDLDLVTEGRDQGTVAFPDATCKIFLTASTDERAKRRRAELESRGQTISLSEVRITQERRDKQDTNRQVGPLVKAEDAIEVCTDGMTPTEVVDHLESLARKRMA
jgi:cytidylate kinase